MDPILVVTFPAIGDFVRCHSAIRIIARRFPDRPIDVITSSAALPLASLMPHVRRGWALDKKSRSFGLAERYRLARELRGQNYRTAYLLSGATKAALAPWLAGIPERIGYPRELQFGLVNRFPADWLRQLLSLGTRHRRFYEEVCDIATLAAEPVPAEGWPAPQLLIPPEQVDDWRRRAGIDSTKPALALYTSGLDDQRRWPIERFISIARDYSRRGWAVRVIGAARERSAAAAIRAAVPEVVDFTSTPLITDAMCQIVASTLFLGVDGGPSHAAAALNVPCVLIFRANRAYDGGPVNAGVRFVEPPISTPSQIEGTIGVSKDQVLKALEHLSTETRHSQDG
ncbi:lipopolysaccharide heptosyltransferase II [Mesorhizobium sp. STM 4661]|uniref:lipopolysaccharide heptosyltransferase II n=1 Tax=Mesorhizobium sp. STM 4661 TaxID=1297570 RepID=UPI0002BD42E7|nr:lipopolysaccharide heptosyltransferase II [Mesorhizobium sp. STM 4661]CCV13569.1 putative ADP-heptose--LPS heptosyltransferase II [Mesorhizobium sp. STM 4661]